MFSRVSKYSQNWSTALIANVYIFVLLKRIKLQVPYIAFVSLELIYTFSASCGQYKALTCRVKAF